MVINHIVFCSFCNEEHHPIQSEILPTSQLRICNVCIKNISIGQYSEAMKWASKPLYLQTIKEIVCSTPLVIKRRGTLIKVPV